ncbi:lytic transglycosylase domain-containing protein [Psychromarinibacter sp. C21-152]|uniref:Lytic transglycosylase domain-containing protein n=1 Tax=Psychromarinibacter sediminicola TaxID=3033385 RepID=A0AAE3NKW9_9RHOB|nr:lytic transglycosylase domain-containing protein [Psychromarinibacter sediminicola]MDF0599793.1 lytic transglycosylase domain-containing protein [Psychromarinibacter sediminicola]
MAALPAAADDPPPFRDFTFKRVKPPKPGAPPRITVQIEPEAEVAPEKTDPETGPDPAPEAYAWYWDKVSPALGDGRPGRLDAALAQLTKGPGVPTPRLASLQSIAETYGAQILAATIDTRVSPALVLAVIGIESAGRPDAVSGKGAAGLMQLMPDTATRFGVTDRADPAQNIAGGVAYLDWLMEEFGGDPILVLAGYNAGEGAVKKHAGVPPYAETRAYVPKVLAAWSVARGLCQTPPMFISDGCAFRVAGIPSES